MNYYELWDEIYAELIESGIDPDDAEAGATERANEEIVYYKADLLCDMLKEQEILEYE